jgi:hypothetical protein
MNKKLLIIGAAVLVLAAGLLAADEVRPERLTIPFSNPAKPGRVEVSTMRGAIKVIGYEGKDVVVEAVAREQAVGTKGEIAVPEPPVPPTPWRDMGRSKDQSKEKEKAAGLKRIPTENLGLSAEEDNNVIQIETESWKRAADLTVRVPFNTSLSLESAMGGSIEVENVSGEIEAEGINGPVTLTNVSGSVTASSLSGEIKAVLVKVAPDKPMSFSTMNGDIDVTLPAATKANLLLKTQRGEVYSDFDIALKAAPAKPAEAPKKEGGKFHIALDNATYGSINGGGPEYRFETFNGNIYIRKQK